MLLFSSLSHVPLSCFLPSTFHPYGKNPDFQRKDLFDSIASGQVPQWEIGVQLINEEDALRYGVDILDPTKIIPVEQVPVTPLGVLTLNRNPTNYFAEVEQASFSPAHMVPGIEASPDRVLQARLFAYDDAARYRLGANHLQVSNALYWVFVKQS